MPRLDDTRVHRAHGNFVDLFAFHAEERCLAHGGSGRTRPSCAPAARAAERPCARRGPRRVAHRLQPRMSLGQRVVLLRDLPLEEVRRRAVRRSDGQASVTSAAAARMRGSLGLGEQRQQENSPFRAAAGAANRERISAPPWTDSTTGLPEGGEGRHGNGREGDGAPLWIREIAASMSDPEEAHRLFQRPAQEAGHEHAEGKGEAEQHEGRGHGQRRLGTAGPRMPRVRRSVRVPCLPAPCAPARRSSRRRQRQGTGSRAPPPPTTRLLDGRAKDGQLACERAERGCAEDREEPGDPQRGADSVSSAAPPSRPRSSSSRTRQGCCPPGGTAPPW